MKASLIAVALLLIVALFATASTTVSATNIDYSQFTEQERMNFVVAEVEEHKIEETDLSPESQNFLNKYKTYVKEFHKVGKQLVTEEQAPKSEAELDISLSEIVNLASKAWKFITDNKAVFNANNFYANALPKGKTAFDLSNWKAPVTASYSASWKNLFGMNVGELKYTFSFIPGGQLKDSAGHVGRYLDRVTIIPNDVFVAWGYSANAETSVSAINNSGTPEAPVAAATVELNFVFGALNKEALRHSFWCRADGAWSKLN